MSNEAQNAAHSLADFAEFLRALGASGVDYVVIGGCAVGAYASLVGETVVSADLDILVPSASLGELLAWAPSVGATVLERPRARAVAVAVLKWRDLEINALTASDGLPDAGTSAQTAREIELSAAGGLVVPVADPFDLLRNKLAIAREKDRPHVAILTRFVEEEVLHALSSREDARERIAPARRLLAALDSERLPASLARRMITVALDATTRRFLVAHVPDENDAAELVRAVDEPTERALLERVLASR